MHFRTPALAPLAVIAGLLTGACGATGHHTSVASTATLHPSGAACSRSVAPSHPLPGAQTTFVPMSGHPFGVAVTPDGRHAFVDELGGWVAVFSLAGARPRLVRTLRVPFDAVGNALTADGRDLLVADGEDGASVIDVPRAVAGTAPALLGTLETRTSGAGAIEAASSRDGAAAFVAIEYGDGVAVYRLAAALRSGLAYSDYVGTIPLGQAVVGEAVSPDGRWLYVTSELARAGSGFGRQGSLSVIDIAQAERDPARAVVASAPAGCGPVRVALSPDGSTVWVTARESDELLAFSAAALRRDPAHALLAAVRVGEAPVGVVLLDHGRKALVADSNRFEASGARAALTLVSTTAALAGRPAVLGTLPAGVFPREMAVDPRTGTVLVGNFGSDQLELVSLPGG